jgi:tellurite resistance protein
MEHHGVFQPDALCVLHRAASDVIRVLRRLRRDEQIALAVLLLAVVDAQDDPTCRDKQEAVRDAVCRTIEAIEPSLVVKEPVQ